jgi:hypothetical protein
MSCSFFELQRKEECAFSMSNLWFHENNSIKYFYVQFSPVSERGFLCLKVHRFFSACPSSESCMEMKTNMEHWWNATERGKPLRAQFFYHESHMDWPGVECRLLR